MKLIPPDKKYEESWKEALKEFEEENAIGFWNVPEKPTNIEEYIQRTSDHAKGKNLPENWVPASTFWLVDKDIFIGHINIRHQLTEALKKIGGHIGYAIRPTERGKGYGTKMLELALEEAKKLGIRKALITCYDANIPSSKIIETNRGKLQDIINIDEKDIRRYDIEL